MVVEARTATALFRSCNFCIEASALFFPTSLSEKMKLLDKSHNSTVPSSCKVTDLTPARMRFFAAESKTTLFPPARLRITETTTELKTPTRMRMKSLLYEDRKDEG